MLDEKNSAELVARVKEHIKFRGGASDARLVWFGYASALLEWGMLSPADYKAIIEICEPIEDTLANEVLLGLPD